MSNKTLRTVLIIAGIILLILAQRINYLLRNGGEQAPVAAVTQTAPAEVEPTLPAGCQPATPQIIAAIQDGHRDPDWTITQAAAHQADDGTWWIATHVNVPDLAQQTATYRVGSATGGPILSADTVAGAVSNWPPAGTDVTTPPVKTARACLR